MILHEIHESTEQYNENGITWKEEYVLNNLDSIVGSSITCEFVDDNRIEIMGHGDTGVEDGLPIFDNASILGTFNKSYIDTINVNGKTQKVVIGEGHLDQMRCNNFIKHLENELNNDSTLYGSVEILGTGDGNKIVYEDGWKPKGRVPVGFSYSGWAMLGIRPASKISTVLELNNKLNTESEESNLMDEKILASFIDSVKTTIIETNSKNTEYETQINDLNDKITELNSTVEELTAKLVEAEIAKTESEGKLTELNSTIEQLTKDVEEGKKKEKIAELNAVLADFTDDERAFADEEIKAFEENPLISEINSVVSKIAVEIVKKAKEAQKVSETNSANNKSNVEDIFGDINETNSAKDTDSDDSIF